MEAPEISAVQSVLAVQRKTPRMREAERVLVQRESATREVEVEGREKGRESCTPETEKISYTKFLSLHLTLPYFTTFSVEDP